MTNSVIIVPGTLTSFSLEAFFSIPSDPSTAPEPTGSPPPAADGPGASGSAKDLGSGAPSVESLLSPVPSPLGTAPGGKAAEGWAEPPADAGGAPVLRQEGVGVAPAVLSPAPERVVFPDGRILVQWGPNATEAERLAALTLQGGVRREVLHTTPMKARGEGVMEVIQLPAGANVEAALAAYNATSGVSYAEVDQLLQTQAVSNDTYYTNGWLWGMYGSDSPTAIGPSATTSVFGSNAEAAWNRGFTGSRSVAVGILDTGIDYEHADLAANMWVNPYELDDGIDNDGNGYVDDFRGWNFIDNTNVVLDRLFDDHGTHVAGTIGANGGNGIGAAGVNWDVTMIASKFMGFGGGYVSGAVQALDYITDLKWRHGINIVATNNSWIGGGNSRAIYDAIVRSARQDILFVVSAGNESSNNDLIPTYPSSFNTTADAGYDAVITVGAITQSGQRAWFSNYGANSVDLGAPGYDILSTVPWNGYLEYSGTSMATPHVTGAVALYASRYPGSTAEQIRAALLASTIPTPSMAGITVTGGRLDVMNYLNTVVPPSYAITANQAHLAEGQAGVTPFAFTITRHGDTTGLGSVSWQVSGTGASPADGQDFDGQILPGGTVSFASGESSKTITVQVKADTVSEGPEAFNVSLLNPSGGATIAAGRASATSRILNDDGVILAFNPAAITIPAYGSALPSPSSLTVASTSAVTISSVEVTLYNLYHSSLDDVDVLLVGPTGARTFLMSDVGGDNSVNGITLTFRPQAPASLPDADLVTSGTWLPTNFDNEDLYGQPDSDEFDFGVPSGPFNADLSVFNGTNPNGAWSLFVRDDTGTAAGKIIDGWSLSISTQPTISTVSLSLSPNQVMEDGPTNLIYSFNRTGPTTNPLTVNYTVGGTATLGTDYSGIPAQGTIKSVTLAAGASSTTVIVDPTADTEIEAPETVALTLAGGSGYIIGTVDSVIGTIQDDDTLVMEGSGASRLLRDAGNRLFVQTGLSTPTPLRFRSKPILQNGFPGWQPLAAETLSGVNQMLWKNIAGNYLSLWTMDSNWNWLSSTGEWGLNSAGAMQQEVNFGLDLNGNGIIGSALTQNGFVANV